MPIKLDNGIVIEEQWTSKNFTPAANSLEVFLENRVIHGGTIHHWGALGQHFDVVVKYLCTNTTPTSAHFVVQEDRVACIVTPPDVAWHAGNAHGNAITIGIECRPEMTPGDLLTLESLLRWLEKTYGSLTIYKHSDWVATQCPGKYAGKINEIVDKINNVVVVVKPPVKVPPVVHTTSDQHGGCCTCVHC